MQAPISEIFSSVQGEGKYVGCRQLFIRFTGCNIKCDYCDTEDLLQTSVCDLENAEKLPNPVSLDDILPYIRKTLAACPHQAISLTGGEPLLRAAFIQKLAKEVDIPLFLETNGTLTEQLLKVIDDIDIISMDIKMPDAVHEELWQEHKSFLQAARQKDVYVKIVVAQETAVDDFIKAVDIIHAVDKNILLVLQPITPHGGFTTPQPRKMLDWQRLALEKINDVRVIGQTHVMMGQR